MRFTDKDGRFIVVISEVSLDSIRQATEESGDCETGGVLLGSYSEDRQTAAVDSVTVEDDPSATRTRFQRGTRGLHAVLARLWRDKPRRYYLGEWHYHPAPTASPSSTDLAQMRSISVSPNYHCPEPLLLIVGKPTNKMSPLYMAVVTADETITLQPGD